MPSAKVRVTCNSKDFFTFRTLLDTCATANLVTERLIRQLRAPKTRCSLTIGAVNELSTTAKFCTQLKIESIYSSFTKELTFFIVPYITERVPNELLPRQNLNIPANLNLADPEFQKPAEIDMLIGTGPTLSLFCSGQIQLSPNADLILQKTKLGWIVGGGIRASGQQMPSKCMLSNLQFNLEKFWALEEVTDKKLDWSTEEAFCEHHFKTHVKRNKDGRYVVALPFRESRKPLGESRTTALKRFQSLQRKFHNNEDFKIQYTKVIQEYMKSGHMSLGDSDSSENFYLPHHAVIKEASNTTKLRVVFDASAKASNGISLNDNLLVGPTIQDDLFALLLRFRQHRYVIISDIEKMYRQFLVLEEDRKYQRILWAENGITKEYSLNTVTFGTASAPFLAIRCLHQLAEDEKEQYPLAASVLKNDMYVDNMLTGTNSVSEARDVCEQITNIFQTAGMKMRQWASNDPTILNNVAQKDLDVDFNFDENSSIKTLGIFWQAKNDCFVYKVKKISTDDRITKRQILSEIAKIFDPIGLLGPIILYAKNILQELWQEKIDWDESVPSTIFYKWKKFCKQLDSLHEVKFERHIVAVQCSQMEIHGFCDASLVGYGACVYLRSININNAVQVELICSKSRVAPLKQQSQTTPRLELCAMQLLASLYTQVTRSLKLNVDSAHFWSDSSVALNWINTPPNQLKTFVSNRVAKIQAKTKIQNWHYVRSSDNPADGLSRGQLPHDFEKNLLWRHGPLWLQQAKETWPNSNIPGVDDLPEKRKVICLVLNPRASQIINSFENASTFKKLIRSMAYCVRLIKKYQRTGPLLIQELNRAETAVLSILQKAVFRSEYERLKNNLPLSDKNQLAPLDPYIDEHDLIQVGGRISKAAVSTSAKHPIILPKGHHVTNLIIKHYHELNHHTGIQNTLYALRQKFWPIDGRNQIKRLIHQCIPCFRAKPRMADYKMGSLPCVRIQQALPFNKTGVDYCGPFYIKEKNYRNRSFIKCYVAIYVCMVTKAVHLEVAENLSTEAFLGALRLFVARRNSPESMYSDNGTNFLGARNELTELTTLLQSEDFNQCVRQ